MSQRGGQGTGRARLPKAGPWRDLAVLIRPNPVSITWQVFARRWRDGALISRSLIDHGSIDLRGSDPDQRRAAILRQVAAAVAAAADRLEAEDPNDSRA